MPWDRLAHAYGRGAQAVAAALIGLASSQGDAELRDRIEALARKYDGSAEDDF